MFWVILVYFNLRNVLPKSGTFLPGHPVYIYIYIYICFHVKYTLFLSDFMKIEFSLKIFEKKSSNFKLHENPFIGSRTDRKTEGRTGGQTDRQTDVAKLTVAFALL